MTALLAALAMVLQDITGVMMMQAEAMALGLPERRHLRDFIFGGWAAWRGAIMDQMQWMVAVTTVTISVDTFGGHSSMGTKAAVFVAVSAANFVGSRTGQELGLWVDRGRWRRKQQRVLETYRASLSRALDPSCYSVTHEEDG